MSLDAEYMRSFAKHGYIVVPQVVPAALRHAATREVDRLVAESPPDSVGSHSYYRNAADGDDPLFAPLLNSSAWEIAASLTTPLTLRPPDGVQVSLNMPVWDHRPGGPHIDGLRPAEPDGRPGTFTLLVGVLLTDQIGPNSGNLWVWPGSHLVVAAYLREHRPEAIFDLAEPSLPLGQPEQITGRAGDLLLAHYLLGHNTGGNVSETVRQTLYFRLSTMGHRLRWRNAVQDPLMEFRSARSACE
jgi:hypothetical protein